MKNPGEGLNSLVDSDSTGSASPLPASRFFLGFFAGFGLGRRSGGLLVLLVCELLLGSSRGSINSRSRITRRLHRRDNHRYLVLMLIEEADQTFHRKLSFFELSGKHQLQTIDHGRIEQSGGNYQIDSVYQRPARHSLHTMRLSGFFESADRDNLVQSASDIGRSETAPETAVLTKIIRGDMPTANHTESET